MEAFPFQKKTWDAYRQGNSGLVHAPTGTGKTYAVWTPALLEWMSEQKMGKYPSVLPIFEYYGYAAASIGGRHHSHARRTK